MLYDDVKSVESVGETTSPTDSDSRNPTQEASMMDATQLGLRMRAIREKRGLTQEAVAEALHLPRTAVTNMEAGARSVSTLELTKLADLYRCTPASFLEDRANTPEDVSVVLMRALQQTSNEPEFRNAVDQVLTLCREGVALKGLLEGSMDDPLPDYAIRMASAGDAIRQGDLVALEERRRLGLGSAPIGNIASVIENQGVWVAACDLPAEMSGLFINDRRAGLAIIVNADHAAVRRRFSYAHEYGHALFDRAESCRLTLRGNADELVEKRANAFAASFLMPRGGIEDQLRKLDKGRPSRQAQIVYDVARDTSSETEIRPPVGSQTVTWQDIHVMAMYFGVSYESIVWRLRNLYHLGPSEATNLLAQKEKRLRLADLLKIKIGDVASPPDDRDQELRSQVVRLAIEAFRREEISAGRLRDLAGTLSVKPADLLELAEMDHAG
jgi:Zn-dependent peptidase ImmA (M78 family)/DNA-binding XRE family transcriptional regulator